MARLQFLFLTCFALLLLACGAPITTDGNEPDDTPPVLGFLDAPQRCYDFSQDAVPVLGVGLGRQPTHVDGAARSPQALVPAS